MSEHVDGSTEWSEKIVFLLFARVRLRHKLEHSIVAVDHRTEVAAGAQVVIHSAVADANLRASRSLGTYYGGQVIAGRPHEISAGFQNEICFFETRLSPQLVKHGIDA